MTTHSARWPGDIDRQAFTDSHPLEADHNTPRCLVHKWEGRDVDTNYWNAGVGGQLTVKGDLLLKELAETNLETLVVQL